MACPHRCPHFNNTTFLSPMVLSLQTRKPRTVTTLKMSLGSALPLRRCLPADISSDLFLHQSNNVIATFCSQLVQFQVVKFRFTRLLSYSVAVAFYLFEDFFGLSDVCAKTEREKDDRESILLYSCRVTVVHYSLLPV